MAGQAAVPTHAALELRDQAHVESLTVIGPVVGRDHVEITQELTYDVSSLTANPYLGLASFEYENKDAFGGRDQQVSEAIERLTGAPKKSALLFVTGASGSGKSSFVQAGVVPALKSRYESQGWTVQAAVVRWGQHPHTALAQGLRNVGGSELPVSELLKHLQAPPDLDDTLAAARLEDTVRILVLDQFEEIFTQSPRGERDVVCALLGRVGSFDRIRTHVLVTLRSDYLPALFEIPDLFERFKGADLELRAMNRDELALAIRRPLQVQARRDNQTKSWDPALVERLIEDMGTDPTLLPLLQVTLTALWDEPPHRLTLARYRSLTDAFNRNADLAYERVTDGALRTEAEKAEVLAIMLSLVDVSLDDDARRDVRRTVPKSELAGDDPRRRQLIDQLIQARLLVSRTEQRDDSIVEVVDIIHESLLHNWKVLRDAIAATREKLQTRQFLLLAVAAWVDHQHSDEYRLQGVRLAQAQGLAAANDVAFRNANARSLLQRSVELDSHEKAQELERARALADAQKSRAETASRSARNLRRLSAVLVAALVLALITAAVAIRARTETEEQRAVAVAAGEEATAQRNAAIQQQEAAEQARLRAQEQATIATSRQIAAEALTHESDALDLALLLGVEANRVLPTGEAQDALLQTLERSPSLVRLARGTQGLITSAAFSPDGTKLATGSFDGRIVLRDGRTGSQIGDPIQGHPDGWVFALAFSPDGRTLASGGKEGSVNFWNPDSGATVRDPLVLDQSWITSLAFSKDGHFLVASGLKGVVEWDLQNPSSSATELPLQTDQVDSVAISPDGSLVAGGGVDGSLVLWDMANGTAITLFPAVSHFGSPDYGQQAVSGISFSSDEKSLVASRGASLYVWSVGQFDTPAKTFAPNGGGSIQNIALSSDSRQIVATLTNQSIVLWNLEGQESQRVSEVAPPGTAHAVAFGPEGRLASGGEAGLVGLWDTNDRLTIGRRLGDGNLTAQNSLFEPPQRVAFAPTHSIVAVGRNGVVNVWNPATSQPIVTLPGMYDTSAVAFSPDGSRLAADDGTYLRLWEVDTWQALGVYRHQLIRQDASRRTNPLVAFEGSGVVVVAGTELSNTEISNAGAKTTVVIEAHDSSSGSLIGEPVHTSMEGPPLGMALRPDGRLLALTDGDGRILNADPMVLEISEVNQVCSPGDCDSLLTSASFGSDGPLLAVADGAERNFPYSTYRIGVLDVAARHVVHTLSSPVAVTAVAIDPAGNLLAVGGADGTISFIDVQSGRRLGRALPVTVDASVTSLAFSQDGHWLGAATSDDRLVVLDAQMDAWMKDACAIAGRSLTAAEWQEFMGSESPFRPTCDGN